MGRIAGGAAVTGLGCKTFIADCGEVGELGILKLTTVHLSCTPNSKLLLYILVYYFYSIRFDSMLKRPPVCLSPTSQSYLSFIIF